MAIHILAYPTDHSIRRDESLPKVTQWKWSTPLSPEEMANVRRITSKPQNHTIIAIVGKKVQIRRSKLHCLRPFHSSDSPESYYLNDDVITSTLHIFAVTHNSAFGCVIQAFTTL